MGGAKCDYVCNLKGHSLSFTLLQIGICPTVEWWSFGIKHLWSCVTSRNITMFFTAVSWLDWWMAYAMARFWNAINCLPMQIAVQVFTIFCWGFKIKYPDANCTQCAKGSETHYSARTTIVACCHYSCLLLFHLIESLILWCFLNQLR